MKTAQKKKLRPEAIMGIIAGCQALVLIVLVILCLPYMKPNDDPLYEIMQNPPAATESTEPTEEPLPEPAPNPYNDQDF